MDPEADSDEEDEEAMEAMAKDRKIAHIALQYWSPYRPTFQLARLVDCPPGEPDDRPYIQARRLMISTITSRCHCHGE